jgi:hypothetical protein
MTCCKSIHRIVEPVHAGPEHTFPLSLCERDRMNHLADAPANPLDRARRVEKFRRYWAYAGRAAAGADRVLALVDELETLNDVAALAPATAP